MRKPHQILEAPAPTGAFVSALELFRIGIGPSSSHTVAPMRAARMFIDAALAAGRRIERLEVVLYGSLAWTGKGHGTMDAVLAGLSGCEPRTVDPDSVWAMVSNVDRSGHIILPDGRAISFRFDRDFILDRKKKALAHPNSLSFRAYGASGDQVLCQDWLSTGGGAVRLEGESADQTRATAPPYDYHNAAELIRHCEERQLDIAAIQLANELSARSSEELLPQLDEIASVMDACIEHGLSTSGTLPGGLHVRRRAQSLYQNVLARRRTNFGHPTEAIDLASAWAIAVNEENAAGGRVVTAPTNGAAGIIPAVLRHWRETADNACTEQQRIFLLTAAAIGGLARTNASISGAEVGCQGEVGVACSMASAGLAAVLGGTPRQVENAAEIGLEHHLGMTCDPIGGLVQIPCIERNAMGAVKAINAASLALFGNGTHRVSLDEALETMLQTGRDMHVKYRETSRGGLARHVSVC